MLERVPFEPKEAASNEAAKQYTPKFIYTDPNNPIGTNIKEEFYGKRRKLRIGVLGAGIATIQFLHSLEEAVPSSSIEVVVYEKNHDVGGVWCSSRYPGCRCDIPGAMYQFNWRPNLWSEWLPQATETWEYLRTVASENDFYRYMHFRHEIIQASWKDDEAKWTLTVKDLTSGTSLTDKVDLFLELNGPVGGHQITIKGVEKFQGKVVHTADWDESIDLYNKKVALLGYGSSGVQIAPEIVKQASTMYTFFRHKTYVLPPLVPEYSGPEGANFRYTEEQKGLLADHDIYLAYRKALDSILNMRFPANVNGSNLSELGRENVLGFMKDKLSSKPGLYDTLAPTDFDVGCRRVTPSHGYLESLVSPKTQVFFEEPTQFTSTGFVDSSGTEHPIDILVAATGYDQSHLPRYPKLVNGVNMKEEWSNLATPPSYMSVCFGGMPNYFNASSTYAAVNGSWYPVAEILSKYFVKFITKMQTENILHFRPKPRAVEHFTRHADAFLERFVMSGPCAAWYKGFNGRPRLWPGNRTHFFKIMENVRFEDFELVYDDEGDMFSYFGNGFVEGYDEVPGEGDLAWYIQNPTREIGSEVLEKLKGLYGEPTMKEEATSGDAQLRA